LVAGSDEKDNLVYEKSIFSIKQGSRLKTNPGVYKKGTAEFTYAPVICQKF
jgi:hypothetical protein